MTRTMAKYRLRRELVDSGAVVILPGIGRVRSHTCLTGSAWARFPQLEQVPEVEDVVTASSPSSQPLPETVVPAEIADEEVQAVEEETTQEVEMGAAEEGDESSLPGILADYDKLTVRAMIARVDDLTFAEIRVLRDYEMAAKNRRTLLRHLNEILATE